MLILISNAQYRSEVRCLAPFSIFSSASRNFHLFINISNILMFRILLVGRKRFYSNETPTILQRFKVRIRRYAWTLVNIKRRAMTWKSRYLLAKKKQAKNKPPFKLGLVHKLCRTGLCAEHIFLDSLCTAWFYKIVQCFAVPAVANSRTITTGRSVSSVLLETRLQNPRVGAALLNIQEF